MCWVLQAWLVFVILVPLAPGKHPAAEKSHWVQVMDGHVHSLREHSRATLRGLGHSIFVFYPEFCVETATLKVTNEHWSSALSGAV